MKYILSEDFNCYDAFVNKYSCTDMTKFFEVEVIFNDVDSDTLYLVQFYNGIDEIDRIVLNKFDNIFFEDEYIIMDELTIPILKEKGLYDIHT